jgi:ribosomal protein S12 methylthiotransferase accessory factor
VNLTDAPRLSAAQALRRMEPVLSPRVGIGRNLCRLPTAALAPRLVLYGVDAAPSGPLGARLPRATCGGAGLSPEEGQASALGELIESYCGSFVPPGATRFGSFTELSAGHDPVEPERFALFSDRQYRERGFPFAPFTRDTRVAWVEGYSLVRRRPVLVPASRVYMPYTPRPGERGIGPMTSTGTATGDSLARATLGALYEVVERDAFTISWLAQTPARAIDVRGSRPDEPLKRLFEERFETPGLRYRVLDVTSDLGVTTVYVVLTQDRAPSPPLHAVGAAARLDGRRAVQKALVEAVQGVPYIAHLVDKEPGWRPAPDFSNVVDFTHNARLYTVAPELAPKLLGIDDRITDTVRLDALPRWDDDRGARAEIEEVTARLAARGYEAVVVDLTTPDVASLGLHVVRVVAPELATLHGSHRLPFLGCTRLFDVPVRLGHRAVPGDEASLETCPHPFP